MSDQYVFELQFKVKADGSDFRENQFVIIDGSSMADFSRLKEDLGMCMPEPFTVQYIDDEEDVISIDTEEEFQEFAKIAKKRSCRGMLMRLILNSTLPLDHVTSPPRGSKEGKQSSDSAENVIKQQRTRYQQFKEVLKKELKNEILSELKEMGTANQVRIATANSNSSAAGGSKEVERMEEEAKEGEYEEDSDNLYVLHLPEANSRKTKLMHHQKKLEKKEKLVEAKIDQRLEKLEMKRKKLMEKYHYKSIIRKIPADSKVSKHPMIVSATVTKESTELTKPVTAGKVFTQFWTVVNDGTVPLVNVELRHTWSTPGLEPLDPVLRVVPLPPGEQCRLAVRFKAPNWQQSSSSIHMPSTLFTSYWHFYRLVGSHWQEFSHYVSMTVSSSLTKPLKLALQEFREAEKTESNKKPKHEEKRVVSFMEAVGAVSAVAESPKGENDEKVVNEESVSNITLKKQMEQLQATLASSEIAADMAREAARLLAMAAAAEGNTTPDTMTRKPSEGDKLNDRSLEEAAAGVQQLNLVDSESDTDTNMETNEESDRGFVIVNMIPDQTGKSATKEDDKTDTQMEDNMKVESQPQPEPMLLPRLDPNVPPPVPGTYPLFTPPPPRTNPPNPFGGMFVPLPQNPCYNYPVLPPTQNSSHGIPPPVVFPPPVNYSQIPTYPPIPNFHHTHPPTVPIPLSQPPFIPVLQNQNLPPFERPAIEKMFWAESAANQEKRTENPAETEKQGGNKSKNAANNVSVVGTEQEQLQHQPQQKMQHQPQQQLQHQPQQQLQQQPQQQLQQQKPQQTEISPDSNQPKKKSDHIEILPQVLVDGAINVAATAYSTAWNALNNLRPKEGEASEFDPVFENNMAVLVEMGFHNLERNARLLKRFHNDISQVIGVICSTGGGHNLDID